LAERERQRKSDKIGVGVGIGVEKEIGMAFGHEKLDVYRAAIETVGWAYRFCEALAGHRNAKEPGEYRTEEIDPDTDADPDDSIAS
jgi:hypothetical protein